MADVPVLRSPIRMACGSLFTKSLDSQCCPDSFTKSLFCRIILNFASQLSAACVEGLLGMVCSMSIDTVDGYIWARRNGPFGENVPINAEDRKQTSNTVPTTTPNLTLEESEEIILNLLYIKCRLI